MTISVRTCLEPSPKLVAKQYDSGAYEYFDVFGGGGECLASFAIGFRGYQAWFLWTIHKPSMAFFRGCRTVVLPTVKALCADKGALTLMCATGDPERDPDFDRVSEFFGFKPAVRSAAMEL